MRATPDHAPFSPRPNPASPFATRPDPPPPRQGQDPAKGSKESPPRKPAVDYDDGAWM
jgi:hypothetical protein